MQSDDFFFRKFKRNSPRTPLSSVNFEHKGGRPAPELAGTTVRARISEWPPRRESLEETLGREKSAGRTNADLDFGALQCLGETDWPGASVSAPPTPLLLAAVALDDDRHEEAAGGNAGLQSAPQGRGQAMQRSNSEAAIAESGAPEGVEPTPGGGGLRREYGSVSSLERRGRAGPGAGTEAGPGEAPAKGQGHDSPAPQRFQDPLLLLGLRQGHGGGETSGDRTDGPNERSYKSRSKSDLGGEASVFRKLMTQRSDGESTGPSGAAASNRNSVGRHKNLITGASAASQLRTPTPGSAAPPSPNGGGAEEANTGPHFLVDEGDGKDTELVLSCPHFRNEIGGEEGEGVSLFKPRGAGGEGGQSSGEGPEDLGRGYTSQCPNAAVSVLEEPRESHRAQQGKARHFVEHADHGASYYRKYFSGKEHQNYFGVDDTFGPLAISLRREDKDKDVGNSCHHSYRVIVRTTEVQPWMGGSEGGATTALGGQPRGGREGRRHE
eukprot:gi/632991364/ref/XP_007884592.1/ PREDICTED: signal-induced proliferation-associated 1-like protein 2 [Callorhinchus milii]